MALMDNFDPVDQLTDNLKDTLQSGTGNLKAEVANTLQEAMSAIGLLSQESRFITFESVIDDDLLIASFEADEGINQETCFNLDCLSPSAFIDLNTLLGQRASIGLATADGGRRYWQGYVTKARALGADGSLSRYQLVMESSLAFLSLRRNSLIYQDKTPLEIVDQLLADYPQVQWRDDTQEPLAARAITTQYRETDHDFLQRLLADASLSWRIEQQQDVSPDDEGPGHTLVIFDGQASLALPLGEPRVLRFHRIAATEKEDAISHFNERRQITPNHFTASQWRNEQIKSIAGSAQAAAGDTAPELPGLDHYDSSASHLALSGDAQHLAQQRLDALRLAHHQYHGKGAVRTLQAGLRYQLSEHATLSGTEFIPLSIHHRATNNLADGLKHTDLNADTLGKGSYRQHFQAVPAGTPIVPARCSRPQAPACSTATVVGIAEQALTTDRDHQIRLQFFWQRGRAPLAGGQTNTHSAQHPDGHATQDETSATWVPVAESLAGAHQGTSFVPRIGSEVLVEFTLGDIDRPLVVGQLYNGTNLPPFHAGDHSNANHPGSLSGIHTQSLDGGLTASWVLDDAPGQLRQGLSHSLANSRLQIGYLIDQQGNHRGQYRGSGIELASDGWLISRAAGGMLVSSSIRHMGQSTQMDATEAVQQLHAAHQQADSLGAASSQGGGLELDASDAYTPLLASIDPQADGKYTAPANGQPSTKPTENARSGGDPVEAFNTPVMLFDSPDSISITSAKSAALFAGEHQHLSSQVDSHIAAHASLASISGDGSGLYAIDGGVNIKANHGPVSLQAHTDQLHIMADKDAKVSAVSGSIKVMAQKSIQLAAGGATITLEGGNITLSAPGNFSVNTATHSWLPGGSKPASLPSLPTGLAAPVSTPSPTASVGFFDPATVQVSSATPTLDNSPCTQKMKGIFSPGHSVVMPVASYYQTKADGTPDLDDKGIKIWLDFDEPSVTFDLNSSPGLIKASLIIRYNKKQWHLNGRKVPYNSDVKRFVGKKIKETPGTFKVDDEELAKKIEHILNKEEYYLTAKECISGKGPCNCKIKIHLAVSLSTDGFAHKEIDLFEEECRADDANWGLKSVHWDDFKNKYVENKHQSALAHEAGHNFGWPDEYFLFGGGVYEKYISPKTSLVNVKMENIKNNWQRFSKNNLMGGGTNNSSTPPIQDYYFNSIRDWFQKNQGGEWIIKKDA